MDEVYLENLQEYIFDEGKIVTYKWLSRELSVHVNNAKQMLWHFWNSRKQDGLSATFLLAGEGVDAPTGRPSLSVRLVSEDKLEIAKSELSSILSVHIYSLSKGAPRDSTALHLTNLSNVSVPSTPPIVSSCIQQLSEEDIARKRNGVVEELKELPKIGGMNKQVKKKTETSVTKSSDGGESSASVFDKTKSKAESNESKATATKAEDSVKQTSTKNETSSKPVSVAAMFSKAPEKNDKKVAEKSDNTAETKKSQQRYYWSHVC